MRESVAWVALSVALAAAIVWPRVPLKDASDRVARVEGLRPGAVPPRPQQISPAVMASSKAFHSFHEH